MPEITLSKHSCDRPQWQHKAQTPEAGTWGGLLRSWPGFFLVGGRKQMAVLTKQLCEARRQKSKLSSPWQDRKCRQVPGGRNLSGFLALGNNRKGPAETLSQKEQCHRDEVSAPWRDTWPSLHLGMKMLSYLFENLLKFPVALPTLHFKFAQPLHWLTHEICIAVSGASSGLLPGSESPSSCPPFKFSHPGRPGSGAVSSRSFSGHT